MSSDVVIKVENLSKCYQIYDAPRDRLKQFVLTPLKKFIGLQQQNYCREFWAINNVSFDVKRGETVGILGRNGSGKSTLLQLICGTLSPSAGRVFTTGRIAALLELGSGFNPEFTGRENVYMSCALLGHRREAVDELFPQIASFADIGEFIDQPVKTYSSGMFVRLAFAVNVISSPDIMIVDEALAVGDMNFQAKCMTALKRFQEKAGTVLFVSHDVGAVKALCQRAIYIDGGEVKASGQASAVAESYIRVMREEMSKEQSLNSSSAGTRAEHNKYESPTSSVDRYGEIGSSPNKKKNGLETLVFKNSAEFNSRVADFRYGTGEAVICYAEILDLFEQPLSYLDFNQYVKVRIYFEARHDIMLSVNYYFRDSNKIPILGAGFRTVGRDPVACSAGKRYIVTYTTAVPLQEGDYSVSLELTQPLILDHSAKFVDVIDNAAIFKLSRRREGRIWAKAYIENTVEIENV
jgi:lipopolysaccharide transport system ATP-binding protein